MPSRAEDKVDDLTKLVSGQVERVDALKEQLGGVMAERGESAKQIAAVDKTLGVLEQQIKDLRGWKESFGTVDQLKIELALLNKEIQDLKRWQEEVKTQRNEWGRRLWMLVGPLLGTTVGWALAYFTRPK